MNIKYGRKKEKKRRKIITMINIIKLVLWRHYIENISSLFSNLKKVNIKFN